MLKVEKIARGKEISLSFRKKESLFSATFLNAFLWAFIFHFGALVIFHVAPFRLSSGRLFPPAIVESEILDKNTVATLEQEGPLKRYLLEPKESQPKLPDIPSVAFMEYLEPIQKTSADTGPFANLEQELWTESFFKPHGKSVFIPCEVQVSGLLSEVSFSIAEEIPDISDSFKASYKVQVENKTGKIYWYEVIEAPESMRSMLEKMLYSLRFNLDLNGFTTPGEVEITFNQRRIYD